MSGGRDNTTRLWEVEAAEQIATLPLDEPRVTMDIAFSPCGKIIAGGMDDEIRLWCAEQLTTLRTIPQPEDNHRTYAFAFSPCGKYLASGTWWQRGMEKMAIRLWDVATGENIHTFWGHTTDVGWSFWRAAVLTAQSCYGMSSNFSLPKSVLGLMGIPSLCQLACLYYFPYHIRKYPYLYFMIINRLIAKNWRNFQEIDVPLRERQFIVGNASGKSNLLDILRFLRDIVKVRWRIPKSG